MRRPGPSGPSGAAADMPLRRLLPVASRRLVAVLVVALGVLTAPPRLVPPASAEGPAVDPDLARELEGEMQSDRAEEQAVWERISEEWKRLSADHTPKRLACLRSEAEISRLQGDIIRYRPLTRDDFRAKHMGEVHLVVEIPGGRVGAHVGLTFVCIGRPHAEELASGEVVAEMQGLRYVALLDRENSWWNPEPTPTPALWILRHEQGHFDLAELYTRRLNRGAAEDIASTRAQAPTAAEAVGLFSARWAAHLQGVRKAFQALEDQYDRETAHGTIPKVQTQWFERIQRELAATRAEAG